ncbi:free methionine-R-sulfoxide reductase [Aspergillus udagawae]|uniref:Free methionine-R-sulfoxide reductase n=1 Tax=Aspergillus udagawae TaxID=91492 RepID=A0A8H3RP34_9EURO|nr:free methionine-R-sulfoxide reductase [Aspergillus udagawae]
MTESQTEMRSRSCHQRQLSISTNPTPAILLFLSKTTSPIFLAQNYTYTIDEFFKNRPDRSLHPPSWCVTIPFTRYPPHTTHFRHALTTTTTTIQPHADSSYFSTSQEPTKSEVYAQVLEQAKGLVTGQRNWVSISPPTAASPPHVTQLANTTHNYSNFSNVASLLWHAYAALPSPSSSVNWAGFYIRQDKFPALGSSQNTPSSTTNVLLLGPFQGRPACQEIRFGRGVCGTAAEKRETVIVPDVLSFPGHIACDASSRSEIVVPILAGGETVAIIDVDCTEPAGFDEEDKKWLEELASLLSECCDW